MLRFRPVGFVASLLLIVSAIARSVVLTPEVARKLDPILTLQLQGEVAGASVTGSPMLSARVEADGVMRVGVTFRADREPAGLHEIPGIVVGAHIGSVWTARLPLDRVASLAGLPEVTSVSAAVRNRLLLDESIPASNVDDVWGSYTGDGVLVGVIDTGIDWRHADFRMADGRTRIKYLFDCTEGLRGREYSQSRIDSALVGLATVNEIDDFGHGTHVAAIAAGNGLASAGTYTGVAKDANLIIYKASGDGGIPDDKVIEALDYIRTKAAGLGKPVAINMSFGTHWGSHDGTSDVEEVVNAVSGPGVIVCVAAGNEGDMPVHIKGTGSFSKQMRITHPSGSGGSSDYVWLDIWYEGSDAVSLTLQGPNGYNDTFASGTSDATNVTSAGSVYVNNASAGADPVNGDKRITVILGAYAQIGHTNPPADGIWTLTFTGATSGPVHAWNAGSYRALAEFLDADYSHLVAMPATASSAITVGAWVSRDCWPTESYGELCTTIFGGSWSAVQVGEIAPFSSPGPTRDGRLKPEISAPGMEVMAALSQDAESYPYATAPGGKHQIQQGTSMASPHAAGVVALLLEARPNATPSQIRNWLVAGAMPWGVARPALTTVFEEDFESGFGDWTVGDGGDGGNSWTRGTNQAHSPSNSAYCLRGAPGIAQAETLISPPITLPDGVTLTLDYWHGAVFPERAGGDHTLLIRPSGDAAFIPLRAYGASVIQTFPSLGDDPDDWVHETAIDLSAWGGETVQLGWSYVGQDDDSWFVDDIAVTTGGAGAGTWNPWFGYGRMDAAAALGETPVDILSFTALPQADGSVMVRWRVTDATRSLGFVLSRSTRRDAGFAALHDGLLPVEGENRYLDRAVSPGRTYYYRLDEQTLSGMERYGPIQVSTPLRRAGPPLGSTWNSPNPFNPLTTISFVLAEETPVRLRVFDPGGRLVRTLVAGIRPAGMNAIRWDGRDDLGRPVASGAYFYRLWTAETETTRRMTLVR